MKIRIVRTLLALALPIGAALGVAALLGATRAGEARAQTASLDGILVSAHGHCLDLTGRWAPGSRPPVGTALALARCDGRASQRWTALYGDYDHVTGMGGHYLGLDGAGQPALSASHQLGFRQVAASNHRSGVLTTLDGRCLEALPPVRPSAPPHLALKACDGGPNQRWQIR